MNFTTPISLGSFPFDISHTDKVISFGSCFSENIGTFLTQHKFDVLINPFGILFNPISISEAIIACVQNKKYTEQDLHCFNKLHFSFNHHSSFASVNKKDAISNINSKLETGHSYISSSNVLFLTLGTAWAYKLNSSKKVVANCYKVPSSEFTKELLSIEEISSSLEKAIQEIRKINPTIKIITTVSPVRHWKDGAIENQQSKSILLLALKHLNENTSDCFYFPSYEIMMDELRDYRFYANDMLHPSELAIKYIWKKFSSCFFEEKTQILNKKIAQINQGLAHRPFNENSESHQLFLKDLHSKISALTQEFPFLKMSYY